MKEEALGDELPIVSFLEFARSDDAPSTLGLCALCGALIPFTGAGGHSESVAEQSHREFHRRIGDLA